MKRDRQLEPILVFIILFVVLYFLTKNNVFFYASLIIGTIGLVSTKLTRVIVKYWECFSRLLGLTITFILLFIGYLIVVVPIGLLGKLNNILNKLDRKPKAKIDSNYVTRNHIFEKSDMETSF